MYKKLKALGALGKHILDTTKTYYKSGGKKTKDIMSESKVSRTVAKADIKSEIKRRAFRNKRPSDFIPKKSNEVEKVILSSRKRFGMKPNEGSLKISKRGPGVYNVTKIKK